MTTAISPDTSADALAERLFGDALRALDLFCVYMGDQLGLYRVLADAGPSTAQELADAAGVNGRYAREWLEQQAMGGVLEVMEVSAMDAERRYALPPGHEEVPLDQDSPFYMAPMAQLMVGGVQPIHAVLAAFRTGQGVPYADYGPDMRQGQERFTRPMFDNLLSTDWFPAVPAIHDRLLADPPARVADLACGVGPVEPGDRPRLPEGQGRRHRPRPGLRPAGAEAPDRQRCRGPGGVLLPGRGGFEAVGTL